MKVAPWLWRRVHARHVAMREHRDDARRFIGGRRIDRHRPAISDGALHDRGVRRVRDWNFRRVASVTMSASVLPACIRAPRGGDEKLIRCKCL